MAKQSDQRKPARKHPGTLDASKWKAEGFIPASDFARALDVYPITAHRWMDSGALKYKYEYSARGDGAHKYRFIELAEAIRFVRVRYSDANVRNGIITKLREAIRV